MIVKLRIIFAKVPLKLYYPPCPPVTPRWGNVQLTNFLFTCLIVSSLFDNSKNFQKLFQVVFSYLQIIVDSRNNEGIYSGQEAHSLTFEYIYLLYINYDVLISMYLNLHQKCVDICFMHLPYRPHGHLCCRTAYLYLGHSANLQPAAAVCSSCF